MNNNAIMFRDKYPDFYVPGIHVHPAFPEESCAEVERLHAQGVRLIGELVPYLMNWNKYADPVLYPVWDLAQNLGMVVNIHPTDNEDMEKLATLFPKMTIVIAHPEEKEMYLQRPAFMERCPNVHHDICGTGLFRYGMLKYGVSRLGSERFLFGTDYPICSAGMQVGGVDSEDISDTDRDNIYYLNAQRILGLN